MNFRIGTGYDLHVLTPGKNLILGGISIDSDKGAKGHSDADVLIHAITDALLGSVAAGDLGAYFPDSDNTWKGVSSKVFLLKALELVNQYGYAVSNIDTTVLLEQPKIRPYIRRIRENLSRISGIPAERISVKATTHEKTGAVGRGEAIACHAAVLIYKTGQDDRIQG